MDLDEMQVGQQFTLSGDGLQHVYGHQHVYEVVEQRPAGLPVLVAALVATVPQGDGPWVFYDNRPLFVVRHAAANKYVKLVRNPDGSVEYEVYGF